MSLPVVAASVLKSVREKKASIKTAVYNSKYPNKKQLMSLVCQVLKYYDVLNEVLERCNLKSSDRRFKQSTELAIVVLYQHLLGKGLNGCYKEFKSIIGQQKSAIHSAEVRVKLKKGISKLSDAVPDDSDQPALPKYARVNTLLASQDHAISQLKAHGYSLTPEPSSKKLVTIDTDVDNLLVFPPGTDLHDNELVVNGILMLQDKASCIPAQVLCPRPNSSVIDACAAPGNKTTQLAAITNNTARITAFDLSSKRCITLRKMLDKAKVTCCTVVNADFLKCDTAQYADVEFILVDPSCSGSGITSRLNKLTDDEQSCSEERLNNLATFQTEILKKALSFPQVQRVVYSTCSVHSIENEQVVQSVLEDESIRGRFELDCVLPGWKNRGLDLGGAFPQARKCIRATTEANSTIGFFVACFVRLP